MARSALRRSLYFVGLIFVCVPMDACHDSPESNAPSSTASGTGGGSADAGTGGAQGGTVGASDAAPDARSTILVVDQPLNQCVFACATNADCPSYFLRAECREGKCIDLGCAVDEDCTQNGTARGWVCVGSAGLQAAGGVCRVPCSTVNDCSMLPPDQRPGVACEEGFCRFPSGRCHAHTCWPGCSEDRPCPGTFRCIEYRDGSRACSNGRCTQASDCAVPGGPLEDEENQRCVQGVCVGIGCVRDDECVSDHSGDTCELG